MIHLLDTNHVINQSKIACCVCFFLFIICCCWKQSDISIESENTLLHDLNIFINKMKTNVIIKLAIHKQEEEMLYA